MHILLVKSDRKAREKPCLRCGYSLRKNFDAKYCPECGLSVWLSLSNNDGLDWSNPPWLAKLSLACVAMAAAQLLGLIAYTGLVVSEYAGWVPSLRISAGRVDILSGVGAAYAIVASVAMLLISSNENRHPDKWRIYKWALRVVAGLGLLGALVIILWLASVPFGLRVDYHQYGLEAFIIASVLTTLGYLRTLAQRGHHSTLARWSGLLLLGSAASLLKAVPILWIMFSGNLILALVALLYLPATCALMIGYAVLFHRSSKSAAKGWESETAGAEPSSASV